VIGTIAVGGFPSRVAFVPDGSKVYVVNANSDSVSVIATATNAVIGSPIPVGTTPTLSASSSNRHQDLPGRRGKQTATVSVSPRSPSLVGLVERLHRWGSSVSGRCKMP